MNLENDAYIKGVLPCAFGSLVTGSNPLQNPDQIRGANAAQGDAGAAEYAASAEVRVEDQGRRVGVASRDAVTEGSGGRAF